MACNSCKLARIKRQIEQRRKLAEMRAKAEAEKKKEEEALAAKNVYVLTPEEEKIMGPNAIDPVAALTVEVPAEEATEVEEAPKKRSRKKKEVVEEAQEVAPVEEPVELEHSFEEEKEPVSGEAVEAETEAEPIPEEIAEEETI